MEIISRGHDIGWVWDPGINVCLHVAECFFFERTWEVGNRQCLLVAIRAGREPLLRGKTSLGAYRAFSQPWPTHPWYRSCHLLSLGREPTIVLTLGLHQLQAGTMGLNSKRKISLFYFFPSSSHFLTEFLPRQTGTNRRHQEISRWSPVLPNTSYSSVFFP